MIPSVAIGERVVRVGSVPTTMDLATELARAGEPSGTVVVADHQTVGRGRLDRRWEVPPGTALLASVLLRSNVPPVRLQPWSLVVGMAIAPVLDGWLTDPTRLKWPNDVLAGDRKVGGILIQTYPDVTSKAGDDLVTVIIVGIGINVTVQQVDLPPGATSLRIESRSDVTVEQVAARLWPALDAAWRRFEGHDGAFDPASWCDRAAYIGEQVDVHLPDRVVRGTLRGVDAAGALQLKGHDGTTRSYSSGEVVRGPRPVSDRGPNDVAVTRGSRPM